MNKLFFVALILITTACSTNSNRDLKNINYKIDSTTVYTLNTPTSLGKTISDQEVYIGGFSGLLFEKKLNGEFVFKTITDRGPNGWQIKLDRPFLIPEFSPTIVTLKTDSQKNELQIVETLPLIKKNGKPMNGLPNKRTEENPVDVFGFTYSIDVDGLDTEALVSDEEGGYWIGEEYGPSLLHFSSTGKMVRRLFPAYELPRVYLERKTNRGFEGITKIGTKIYGFLQSQLPIDKDFSRIVEFDLETYRTSAEYFYKIEEKADRVGDAVALPDNSMLVIEQNGKSGEKSFKKIYRINLNKSDELVTKSLVVDLDLTPFKAHEKIEGISVIDRNHIAVVNDNDFAISAETNFKTGITPLNGGKSELMIIKLDQNLY
jgi:3-phytase